MPPARATKPASERADAPIVSDRLAYQADGAGYLRAVRKHVHVLDVETKECSQLTHGDWHAGDPSWSPDGATLAFAAETAPDADLKFRAPVYTVAATGGAAPPKLIGLEEGLGARSPGRRTGRRFWSSGFRASRSA